MAAMISVEEALQRILDYFHRLEPETVPLLDTLDRVLAEDVYSDIDIPPFDNSAMDGYAVQAEDVASATDDQPARLKVIADLAAGYVAQVRVGPGEAVRIMTGAPLPAGADAVVRFEDTDEAKGPRSDTVLVYTPVASRDNVRPLGEDVRKGELVIQTGTRLRPSEIGVLASLGRKDVSVIRRPKVAILATGDELLEIDQPIAPGKIRNSNSYSVASLVRRYGGVPVLLGIARDTREDVSAKLAAGASADMLISTAGVSVGDFDVVKEVMNSEGQMYFWTVRMKPGKPLAFGRVHNVPILGLPGNPVSSMVSFEQFARPAILKMQGRTNLGKPEVDVTLMEDVNNSGGRRNFIRAVVKSRDGRYYATTTGEQGSGVLTSMARANALVIIPEDVRQARAGDIYRAQMLDWDEDVATLV